MSCGLTPGSEGPKCGSANNVLLTFIVNQLKLGSVRQEEKLLKK